ncbi:MAG: metal-dependent transcriptional regulator [Eggerthellaceae bacterium]
MEAALPSKKAVGLMERGQPVQENGGASVVDGSDFELSEVELMTLSESREDYLENLLILETRSGGFVRQVDMASRMGFSKASISKAMSSLSAEGYVEFRPRGLVRLSNGGRKIAERVYDRHCFFFKVLTNLGIPTEIAQRDACRMEHAMSEESYQALKKELSSKMDVQ